MHTLFWLKNVVLKLFSSATGEPAVCNTQITHVSYAKYICVNTYTSSGLWLALGQVALGDMQDFTVLISCLFLTCVQSPFSQIIYLLSMLANKPFDLSTWLVSWWTDLLPSATMRLRTLLCKINQRDFTQLIVLRLDRCQVSDTFTFIWRLLQELT